MCADLKAGADKRPRFFSGHWQVVLLQRSAAQHPAQQIEAARPFRDRATLESLPERLIGCLTGISCGLPCPPRWPKTLALRVKRQVQDEGLARYRQRSFPSGGSGLDHDGKVVPPECAAGADPSRRQEQGRGHIRRVEQWQRL